MQGPFSLFDNMLRSPTVNDGDRLGVLGVSYVDELVLADLDLLHQFCVAQRFLCQVFYARDYSSARCFREFLEVSTTDVLDCGDSVLCQIMQRYITDSFLGEENVRSSLLDLSDHVLQHLLLFFDEEVHLVWIVDVYLSVELRLFNLK